MALIKGPEIKQNHIDFYGEELGTIIFEIDREWHQLNREWIVYRNLFETNQERHDIMHAASPSFFDLVKHSLMITTIMRASRLLDPEKSCGKENLTIRLLPNLVPTQHAEDIQKMVDSTLTKFSPMKDWRNRLYAHNDYERKIGVGDDLSSIRPSMVTDLIDSIMSPIDFLNLQLRGIHRANRLIASDATELNVLYLLDSALRMNPHTGYPEWLRQDIRNGVGN